MTTVDAHMHIWRLARGDYFWLSPESGVLYQDYSIDFAAAQLQQNGIEKGILVQATDTLAETEFLLKVAQQNRQMVAGVVGWVDCACPGAPARLAQLRSQHPQLVGLRPMLQDIAADDWISGPRVQLSLKALSDNQLTFDALVTERHLPHLLNSVAAHPELRWVIDHAAKPDGDQPLSPLWRQQMRHLAELPNVWVKVSGLCTESRNPYGFSRHEPVLSELVTLFGSRRLIWASDWPVIRLRTEYAQWYQDCKDWFDAQLGETETAWIMGNTAALVYRLDCANEA